MASVVVQVFSFGLDRPDDAVERMDELLPVAERDAPPRVLIARASTRLLLADALGVAPASLRISRRCAHCGHPTHGRPVLEGDDRLSFSVSHSGSLGVVALGDGDLLIGIDVEVVRPRVRLDALAARVLDAGSYAEWRDLGSDEQLVSFLRAWTAKE
ncbi:MAG TPA: hypothetical protein VL119_02340, partial [Acidimicrobiia bacterium]|nr:hypothetical protein [Acidimicrobiia bacterium]